MAAQVELKGGYSSYFPSGVTVFKKRVSAKSAVVVSVKVAFQHGLEFARRHRITELIVIEVHNGDAHAVFHLAFA